MRYHKIIGFPNTLIFPNIFIYLNYWTKHAAQKRDVQYKKVPTGVLLTPDTAIEITTDDDIHIQKAVIRQKYDNKNDIIISFRLRKSKSQGTIISFWLNDRFDQHATLDKSKYNIPK